MRQIRKIPEWIIKISFKLSVWMIERFHNMKVYDDQLTQLRQLEPGTLGREIADCLDSNNLRLVPNYESHDLKHSLLNYKMTPVDEIRLQAFMIGNGNVSIPSIAIFTFGFILLPSKWPQFAQDFHSGLNAKQIKEWTIAEFADHDLKQLRNKVILTDKKAINVDSFVRRLAYAGSIFSMIAGVVGMIFCLPFLFSNVMADLVGAGFPFVGGALLFIGGLISLSIRTKQMNTTST